MSSKFVSAGTVDQPIERDDDWLQAQKEIEASRRRKEEESRQEGGKSLYEVLQQNKAAKQEAFEESIRLKNQFRNLDEDEIEFLDSVLESTRAKEEALKRETTEQVNLFRHQQEEADRVLLSQINNADDATAVGTAHDLGTSESQWTINARKKRKRVEKEVHKGVKLRKASSPVESFLSPDVLSSEAAHAVNESEEETKVEPNRECVADENSPSYPKPSVNQAEKPLLVRENALQPSLGLAAYSSDDEN